MLNAGSGVVTLTTPILTRSITGSVLPATGATTGGLANIPFTGWGGLALHHGRHARHRSRKLKLGYARTIHHNRIAPDFDERDHRSVGHCSKQRHEYGNCGLHYPIGQRCRFFQRLRNLSGLGLEFGECKRQRRRQPG